MQEKDQRYRNEADEIRNATLPPEEKEKRLEALWEKQVEVDKRNIKRLTGIIGQYGWPGNSLVGKDGSLTAFLIVQHSEACKPWIRADSGISKAVRTRVQRSYKEGKMTNRAVATDEGAGFCPRNQRCLNVYTNVAISCKAFFVIIGTLAPSAG